MSPTPLRQATGDCDCCDKTNTVVTLRNGMLMCDDCRAKEDAVVPTLGAAESLIQQSRSIDASIQVKSDIFNAQTVAAIELKGAIDADDTIPEDQKNYIMAQESMKRFQHMQQVVFGDRQTLLAHENEMRMWQTQVQTFAGKLRSELREQFKTLNIEYAPKAVSPVKATRGPKAPKQTDEQKEAMSLKACREAAAKYGVAVNLVKMTVEMRKISAEEAAKIISSTTKK